MPRVIITLENSAILLLAIYLFYVLQGSWIVFAVLFIVPDVSMIGYLFNTRWGAYTYNAIHNYTLPFVILIIAAVLKNDLLAQLTCILTAHVALDRAIGFGLKYPTHFKDTHIQRLSRKSHPDEL